MGREIGTRAGRSQRVTIAVLWCLSVSFAVSAAGVLPALVTVALALSLRRLSSPAKAALLVLTLAGCTEVVTVPPLRLVENAGLLEFHARRASGEITPLPPRVSHVVSNDSDLVLSYQEKMTQNYSGVPDGIALFFSGFFHLLGVPLGSNEVRVTATLTLTEAGREPFRLNAEATASSTYGFYYGAKMSQLDEKARRSVRLTIDQMLVDDLAGWLN